MEGEADRVLLALYLQVQQGQPLVNAAVYRRCPASVVEEADAPLQERSNFSLSVYEFLDNHQLSSLDSLAQQIGESGLEVYIPEESATNEVAKSIAKKVQAIFSGRNITPHNVKKSLFTKKADTVTILERGRGRNATHVLNRIESERVNALGCMECIWQVLKLRDIFLSSEGDAIIVNVDLGVLEKHMRLDSPAVEAVNLLPRPDHPSPFGSLFGVLNRCKTKLGSRTLERWLRQPLLDLKEIQCRHDIVEILSRFTVFRDQLRDGPLKSMPDLQTIANKMRKKSAGLAELYRLYVFARSLPAILSVLGDLYREASESELTSASESLDEKFASPLSRIASKFRNLDQLVETVVDIPALPELRINPQHDPSLQELAQEREGLEQRASKIVQDAKSSWAFGLDVKLERHSQHGLVMRSTRGEDERKLRESNSSVKIVTILKNGTYFTVIPLERLSDRLSSIDREYEETQERVVQQAMDVAVTYLPLLEAVGALLSELDVLCAFSTVVTSSPTGYCRPTILSSSEDRKIHIKAARHPCVELMDNVSFLPNDYELHNKASLQLITGPNMGGKSTYIRALGCCVVLAQVGMFVPAEEATLAIVDSVLARVGAGDSTQKGVSTFLAEMQESAVILHTATKNSLLIVDELGRGTSTHDGFGIAWAICDHILANIGCLCVFATHFHELTALAERHPDRVVNRHVTAVVENGELRMLYQLQEGPCMQSFGIHVAKTAGFPRDVIEEAQRKANLLERHVHVAMDSTAAQQGREKRQRVEDTLQKFSSLDIPHMQSPELRAVLKELFPLDALQNVV